MRKSTPSDRACTDGAPEPVFFSHMPLGTSLVSFTSVTADDIVSAISRLPDKSSAADPLPVSVMKLVADEIAPFLTELFNRSMSAGHFPSTFKEPLSRRQLRSLGSMSQMLSRIVRSLIFRWCLSYLSGLSYSNSTPIYSPPVFFRLSSLAFGRAIRQKLLFFAFCVISCRLSTLEMSLHWCC